MKHKKSTLRPYVHPISGTRTDYDPLINYIGDASIVLLGEATHGTHEFYEARAEITKRLIKEKGFTVVAIEGDFPDTYRVNRYIHHEGDDKSSVASLADFKRFPAWMWRNEEFVSFIDWLRVYNTSKNLESRIDIYGLDVYSLHRSIEIVIDELEKIDSAAAQQARKFYQCFDAYADPQEYGYLASLFPNKSCRDEAINQLVELMKKQSDFFKKGTFDPLEEKFYLEQNALIVKNAENYYRSIFSGDRALSWNTRDRHMMEVVMATSIFKQQQTGTEPKIVVWAHNSHIGDARATQMSEHGELNIGQLAKERYGTKAISVGFTTYTGTVSAASAWGGEVKRKYVRPALDGSIELMLHLVDLPAFVLIPKEDKKVAALLSTDYLERAIGVVYVPQTERASHYFHAQINKQFDAIIHFDQTNAVAPLEKSTEWEEGEDVPETFPFGV